MTPTEHLLRAARIVNGGEKPNVNALARAIEVSQSTMWDWQHIPGRKVDPEAAIKIEAVTGGKVKVVDLRPDLAALLRPRKRKGT